MIKDAIDDILRHRADAELNSSSCLKLNKVSDQSLIWKNVRCDKILVGDIICCRAEEEFPCDLLALSSSENNGLVQVTTANLDGETNIKKFFSHSSTQSLLSDFIGEDMTTECAATSTVDKIPIAEIICQHPVDDLSTFEGRIRLYSGNSENFSEESLSIDNLLLRGARLKHTKYVVGLVVYTGRDTKLSLNSKEVKRKFSSIEGRLNEALLFFIFILIILLIILTGCTFKTPDNTFWYLPHRLRTAWTIVQDTLSFLFIMNFLIPISIIITIEIAQLFAALWISSDIQMYDPSKNIRARSNTTQLADELGQIEFLFSDK
ncbi:unnamed protein product, partial [Protopolystoma xenopodis]